MLQTFMVYNKCLTHSAESLEDNSPSLLEGTLFRMPCRSFFPTFFFTLLNHCVLAFLNQLSWMGEVGHVITVGKMADLAHERSGQSTLWDQEHPKSEGRVALEIEFVSLNALICWWEENYTGSPWSIAIRMNSPVTGWALQCFNWF